MERATLRMPTATVGQQGSPLRVLWVPSIYELFNSHPSLFANLSSLKVDGFITDSHWRQVLDGPSKTLGHLGIKIRPASEEVPALHFPLLEILEVSVVNQILPAWMTVPESLKLITKEAHTGLPSLSELQVYDLSSWRKMESSCPTLQVLRYEGVSLSRSGHLFALLNARRDNVKAGLEVEGIKIEPLPLLATNTFSVAHQALEGLKELVEKVVNLFSDVQKWGVNL